jgi:hypothetical protein
MLGRQLDCDGAALAPNHGTSGRLHRLDDGRPVAPWTLDLHHLTAPFTLEVTCWRGL